jgi:hypothetical protein
VSLSTRLNAAREEFATTVGVPADRAYVAKGNEAVVADALPSSIMVTSMEGIGVESVALAASTMATPAHHASVRMLVFDGIMRETPVAKAVHKIRPGRHLR